MDAKQPARPSPFVAYYRVSTQRQGRSGLGIEAQKAAVARFAEAENLTQIAEFTEVETGKGSDALERRPQLAAAPPPPGRRNARWSSPSSIDSPETLPSSPGLVVLPILPDPNCASQGPVPPPRICGLPYVTNDLRRSTEAGGHQRSGLRFS
jgi:hypothetical protein